MDKANSAKRPHFEIGQAVLVDEGLPDAITAVKRGTVLDQTDVPEYNLVPQPAEQVKANP